MTTECIASKLEFKARRAPSRGRIQWGADHLRLRGVAVTGGGEPLWVH